MRAMQINGPASDERRPVSLETAAVAVPEAGPGQVLIRVHGCAVCHTEIDEIEGRTPPTHFPMTPGHQVVGEVVGEGPGCSQGLLGSRVGVAWIYSACESCQWCLSGRENLCPDFQATGRDAHGGYAEYMAIGEDFTFSLPEGLSDLDAAPLLCAGAVGYRALHLCDLENGEVLGLTGFGASGHLVLQMAKAMFPDSPVFVFARDAGEQDFSLKLGADWAGDTRETPPRPADAIIDTTPAWLPIVSALEALSPGGRLVINAIRKEAGDQHALRELDYDRHLWREKSIQSVANVTRNDVRGCLDLAAKGAIRATAEILPLEGANEALNRIRKGGLRGAFVLQLSG